MDINNSEKHNPIFLAMQATFEGFSRGKIYIYIYIY